MPHRQAINRGTGRRWRLVANLTPEPPPSQWYDHTARENQLGWYAFAEWVSIAKQVPDAVWHSDGCCEPAHPPCPVWAWGSPSTVESSRCFVNYETGRPAMS